MTMEMFASYTAWFGNPKVLYENELRRPIHTWT
jgi:hypothetical protein